MKRQTNSKELINNKEIITKLTDVSILIVDRDRK